jgi:hypothetical protein
VLTNNNDGGITTMGKKKQKYKKKPGPDIKRSSLSSERKVSVYNAQGVLENISVCAAEEMFNVTWTDSIIAENSTAPTLTSTPGIAIKHISVEIGYGIVATRDFQKGERIISYSGRKESLNDGYEKDNVFTLTLSDNTADSAEIVSARYFGNESRFINHAPDNVEEILKTFEQVDVLPENIQFSNADYVIKLSNTGGAPEIIASTLIKSGEPIYCSYGLEYWHINGVHPILLNSITQTPIALTELGLRHKYTLTIAIVGADCRKEVMINIGNDELQMIIKNDTPFYVSTQQYSSLITISPSELLSAYNKCEGYHLNADGILLNDDTLRPQCAIFIKAILESRQIGQQDTLNQEELKILIGKINFALKVALSYGRGFSSSAMYSKMFLTNFNCFTINIIDICHKHPEAFDETARAVKCFIGYINVYRSHLHESIDCKFDLPFSQNELIEITAWHTELNRIEAIESEIIIKYNLLKPRGPIPAETHQPILNSYSCALEQSEAGCDVDEAENENRADYYMNTLLYSRRLHKTFQAAYEKGQKESRERSGYGEGAMVVYPPKNHYY